MVLYCSQVWLTEKLCPDLSMVLQMVQEGGSAECSGFRNLLLFSFVLHVLLQSTYLPLARGSECSLVFRAFCVVLKFRMRKIFTSNYPDLDSELSGDIAAGTVP